MASIQMCAHHYKKLNLMLAVLRGELKPYAVTFMIILCSLQFSFEKLLSHKNVIYLLILYTIYHLILCLGVSRQTNVASRNHL